MKKFLSVLVIVLASVTLAVPAAQANAPACASRREARHVHQGMSVVRVRRIFDTAGHVASRTGRTTIRSYRPCRRLHAVSVAYRNGQMVKKVVF